MLWCSLAKRIIRSIGLFVVSIVNGDRQDKRAGTLEVILGVPSTNIYI